MKFQADKVVSSQEINRVVSSVIGFTHHQKESSKTLPLGFADCSSIQAALLKIINTWVQRIEGFISLLKQEDNPQYDQLLTKLHQQRGCTFTEYCRIFDGFIPEEEYRHHPAFAFFGIHSEGLRRQFITNRQAEKEGFLAALSRVPWSLWDIVNQKVPADIPLDDLHKHCYISGKSGSGKSELIKTMIYHLQLASQEKRDKSVVLLDPQGDLAENVRDFHLNIDHDRLIYIDPYIKNGLTPTLNPLHIEDRSEVNITRTSEELVNVLEEIMEDAELSNQMRAFVTPCIAVLLRKGDASLVDLQTFMDDNCNEHLVQLGQQSPHPSHRYFFRHQFTNSAYKRTKMSIYTRLQSLMNSQTFYNLVVGKSTINLSQAMDEGKIIIFNLSKGRMGIEASEAFGRFVIATLQCIAQRRAEIRNPQDRKTTYVFIDEFQNYLSDSIQTILQEARKYAISLILANQTMEDIQNPVVLSNILNNTEVKIVGRNGTETLSKLAKELLVDVEVLQNMKRYRFYVKSGDAMAFEFASSAQLKQTQYRLTKAQINELTDYLIQISGQYKAIDLTTSDLSYQDDVISLPNANKSPSSSPKAKFDLSS